MIVSLTHPLSRHPRRHPRSPRTSGPGRRLHEPVPLHRQVSAPGVPLRGAGVCGRSVCLPGRGLSNDVGWNGQGGHCHRTHWGQNKRKWAETAAGGVRASRYQEGSAISGDRSAQSSGVPARLPQKAFLGLTEPRGPLPAPARGAPCHVRWHFLRRGPALVSAKLPSARSFSVRRATSRQRSANSRAPRRCQTAGCSGVQRGTVGYSGVQRGTAVGKVDTSLRL